MFTSQKHCLTVGLLLFVMLEITCALIPESRCLETCRHFQNVKFDGHCPTEGACDWQCAAQRLNCTAPSEYHCARQIGLEHRFVNVCAMPKQCRIGEEPAISFTSILNPKNPVVWCIPCFDKKFYNDRDNRMSSTFSQCLYKKFYHCTKDHHKIDCGPERGKQAWDVQTQGDGFCRCDARDGYEPKFKDEFDIEEDYCFEKKVECVKKDCGTSMELSLNYRCIPKCAEGLVRTQLSDMCSQMEISSSPLTNVSVLPTFNTNRTETVTMSPNPQNSTMGPSPDQVNKMTVIPVAISVTLVIIIIIILSACFVYKTILGKKRKKEVSLEAEREPLNQVETTEGNTSSYELQDMSTVIQKSSDVSETRTTGPSTQLTETYISNNYYGPVYKIIKGKTNINEYGESQKDGLVRKKGTASDNSLHGLEENGDWTPSSYRSSSLPDLDHGSSIAPLQGCISAAETEPSPPVTSIEGQGPRSGLPPEKPASFVCHPSDDQETESDDDDQETESDDRDIFPERIPAGIDKKEFKPIHSRQGPDVDGAVPYMDDEVISDEKKEQLAIDLLNDFNWYFNWYLTQFDEEYGEDLTTTLANLKKMAANKNVDLDNMFEFHKCVRKPPTSLQDGFTCAKCGRIFIRGKSTGENNCCMYQSISQLLCGDERLQNRLRLCSTLHAVRRYKDYIKQMEAFAGKEESPWKRVNQILGAAGIDTHGAENWKVCLREGIRKIVVQTSDPTRDSCEIHIMFLSHALRCKITQHFEDCSYHEDTEDCPVLEEDTENTSDVLDLHILWNKGCNHLTPLFKI